MWNIFIIFVYLQHYYWSNSNGFHLSTTHSDTVGGVIDNTTKLIHEDRLQAVTKITRVPSAWPFFTVSEDSTIILNPINIRGIANPLIDLLSCCGSDKEWKILMNNFINKIVVNCRFVEARKEKQFKCHICSLLVNIINSFLLVWVCDIKANCFTSTSVISTLKWKHFQDSLFFIFHKIILSNIH